MLNYTYRRRDVLTLAHELGHGVHAALGGQQGVFHMATPLTLAETASVFGETIVFGRLLEQRRDAGVAAVAAGRVDRGLDRDRLPPGRDEPLRAPRPHRRAARAASSSLDRIGELWAQSQEELLGDAVEVTEGYRTWWSYVPHFISVAGLRLRVRLRAAARAGGLRPLRGGGRGVRARLPRAARAPAARKSPEELGEIVGVDLADPGFWDNGPRPRRAQARRGRAGRAGRRPAVASRRRVTAEASSGSAPARDASMPRRAARTSSSTARRDSSTACASSMPGVPTITAGMPRAQNRRMSAP